MSGTGEAGLLQGKVPSENRGERVLKRFIARRWRQSSVALAEMNLEKGGPTNEHNYITASRQESPSSPLRLRTSNSSQKNGTESAETGCRFFLAKPGGSGESPVFGREFSKEGEAMVEALKSGITYYVVTEWRPVADLSGKTPQSEGRP